MAERTLRRVLRRAGRCAAALAAVAGPALVEATAAQAPEPTIYEVDGVRVVQLELPGHELVAANLYLLGGARQVTAENAGVERLILSVSQLGTEGYPGEAVREEEARSGSRFIRSTAADWSVIGFTGLVEEFEASWDLLADRVVRPSFDSTSLEVIRNQVLTSLRADRDDPDAAVRRLAQTIAFEGHPYAVDPGGTGESVSALSVADLRAYHHEQFVRSRMLLSVVGGVGRAAVEAAIRSGLAALPVGSYTWTLPPSWAKELPRVASEERTLPTNYIFGYFGGPTTMDEDYPAFQVALVVLSSIISNEIRAQGLSYVASAPLLERAASGGGIYVTTVDPDRSLQIVNDAIETFRENTLQRFVFRDYAEGSALDYYLANQTVSQQAGFLASSLLLRGRTQTVVDWVEELRDVTGGDVRRMFNEYVRNVQYGYLGVLSRVPEPRLLEY